MHVKVKAWSIRQWCAMLLFSSCVPASVSLCAAWYMHSLSIVSTVCGGCLHGIIFLTEAWCCFSQSPGWAVTLMVVSYVVRMVFFVAGCLWLSSMGYSLPGILAGFFMAHLSYMVCKIMSKENVNGDDMCQVN